MRVVKLQRKKKEVMHNVHNLYLCIWIKNAQNFLLKMLLEIKLRILYCILKIENNKII